MKSLFAKSSFTELSDVTSEKGGFIMTCSSFEGLLGINYQRFPDKSVNLLLGSGPSTLHFQQKKATLVVKAHTPRTPSSVLLLWMENCGVELVCWSVSRVV